jgi:hypothetical protein
MDLARAAAALARVPYASVRFMRGASGTVGATYGLDHRGDMAAAEAFASLALLHADSLVIENLVRAKSLPTELQPDRTRLRWFGSLPVQTRNGTVVGVVCVFDRDVQPEERARLDDVAHLVHGLDVVGAILGRAGRRDVERGGAPPRAAVTADLAAEVGILCERIEVLARAAARREIETDERSARAWLAVELDALRAVADRAHMLASKALVESDEDAAAA